MTRTGLRRAALVLIPLAVGAGAAAWLSAQREPPPRADSGEPPRAVRVIAAPRVEYVPSATGYGQAQPVRTWRAVPQVSGEIVGQYDGLKTGALVPAGTELIRIDATDYRLAVAEAEATIAAKKAQLEELDARDKSTRRSLEIERGRLQVARRELDRQRTLRERGTVPQATVDRQEREFLQQRQAVQDLENQLATLPPERQRLEAELARERVRLEQARRDIDHTVIKAPFDLRVDRVLAETGQYVQAGETVVEADSVAASEVEAQVPIDRFRALLTDVPRLGSGGLPALQELLPAMGLKAEVRLRTAGPPVTWTAHLDRIGDAIDVETRTVGAVAVVERPYEKAQPPEKPPLVKGMYVEVRLCAPPRPAAVVIPQNALHEDRVYVAARDRLEIRRVTVADRQGDFVVIGDGLDADERVVLTDLIPAIEGMRLDPQPDEDSARRLEADAKGEGRCP